VHHRLVTRYSTKSAEAADENQRRVEGVFAALEEAKPGNVSYLVLRLDDDSFVHISFHNHGDGEVNPIGSTAAFAHFQRDHSERRSGGVDQHRATLVGALHRQLPEPGIRTCADSMTERALIATTYKDHPCGQGLQGTVPSRGPRSRTCRQPVSPGVRLTRTLSTRLAPRRNNGAHKGQS
jgi:hypothetical protein